MAKNERTLQTIKHPHSELAVGEVVKEFTIKKGVLINMARKTTLANENAKEEKKNGEITVKISHPVHPWPYSDEELRGAAEVRTCELRRAVATRYDYYSYDTYETFCGKRVDAYDLKVQIVKGVAYYYLTIYLFERGD